MLNKRRLNGVFTLAILTAFPWAVKDIVQFGIETNRIAAGATSYILLICFAMIVVRNTTFISEKLAVDGKTLYDSDNLYVSGLGMFLTVLLGTGAVIASVIEPTQAGMMVAVVSTIFTWIWVVIRLLSAL